MKHLRQLQRLGPLLEQQDLDEVAAILGHRPDSMLEANQCLEARIREADPAHDEKLFLMDRRGAFLFICV